MDNHAIEFRVEGWDVFAPVYRQFQSFISKLREPSEARLHTDVEAQIVANGRDLHRAALQAYLDTLSSEEKAAENRLSKTVGRASDAPNRVTRVRDIESLFGTVRLKRLGYRRRGQPIRFPLDARLGLPSEKYSLALQRQATEEARVQSFAEASKRVDQTTGGHIPVRQLEESVVRAAVDFDTFYEQKIAIASDAADHERKFPPVAEMVHPLLVLSTDASGVTVIDEALREATRKAREEAEKEAVRGDPMAKTKARRCTKRMAQVTGIWDQVRTVRTPSAIIAHIRNPGEPHVKIPKPTNKRITASLEHDARTRIDELFDEADRRDPHRARETIMLIDGAIHQRELVEEATKAHNRTLTIVLDIIHVLHYLWIAGNAICAKDKVLTAIWVNDYLEKILTDPVESVVAEIRQSSTRAGIQSPAIDDVDKCAQYLLNNAKYVAYADYLARGLPIASGVIEGACRHLCHDRLDITGARWSVATAEAMLRIRALHTNQDWDAYWAFHIREEIRRNHGSDNNQDTTGFAAA